MTPAVLDQARAAGVAVAAGDDPLAVAEQLKSADSPVGYERLSRRTLKDPTIPWPTLLSGVLLVNLFYWCTNQQIIQRTLAADGLANGQKGVLLAAGFKLVAPVVMVVPGMAALHLYGSDLVGGGEVTKGADAYGRLVGKVLQNDLLLGFFAAVVFGSILSTFNSVLNSTATLFSLGVYKAQLNPDASEAPAGPRGADLRGAGGGDGGDRRAAAGRGGGHLRLPAKDAGAVLHPDFRRDAVGLQHPPPAGLGGSRGDPRRGRDRRNQILRPGWEEGVSLDQAVDGVMHNWHFIGCVFTVLVLFLGVVWKLAPTAPKPALPASPVDMTPWPLAVPVGIALTLGVLGLYVAFL